jgi:general secretion pathway protein G
MKMRAYVDSGCRGFTLVELLVTLALVGLLASVAIPMTEVTIKREREQELRETLRTLRRAIDGYKQAVDEGRIVRKADESGYPSTLEILANGVTDQRDPRGSLIRFLRQVPRDPMNRDMTLDAAKTWGKRSYASSHEAPMEERDVYDVYSLEPGAGLNGMLYRQW